MRREIHYGVVVDNADPDKLGGLKVRVDTLLDQLPLLDEFIPPCFPFAGAEVGWFFVPEIGAQVEVEVEADPELGVEEIDARWRATLYSDNDAPPAEFTSDYPNRAGIKWGPVILTFDKTQDLMALVSSNVRLGEEAAPHPVMRGDTYNTEEQTLYNQWVTYLGGMDTLAGVNVTQWQALADASVGPLAPLKVPFEAQKAAWQSFQSQVTSLTTAINTFLGNQSTWLSTKVKTE